MTPAARTAATIELLGQIADFDRPADGIVAAYFRARRYVGSKDRADIAERIYRLLRHHARLGWWLETVGHEDGARNRVIAELVLAENASTEDLAARFDGSRYGPDPLTEQEQALIAALRAAPQDIPLSDEERAIAAKRDLKPVDHPRMPVRVLCECPDWAADSFGRFGADDFRFELNALLQPAPFDLRVNELKGDRERIAEALRRDGIDVEPTPLSPVGLRVQGRSPLAGHKLYREGVIEVQDEGAQLAALLVDARPGQQVVDFCAGAGGKALALGARMAGKGRVVACDVSAGRLSRAKERLHRSGLDNVEIKRLESERDNWVRRQKSKFDRVLIDAPCSGSGTWRRDPDARWRPVDLAALTNLQSRILESACRLVRPGGRLVYVTCSLIESENEGRVDRFLAEHPAFETMPVADIWSEVIGGDYPGWGAPRDSLQLTPARHGTDGFFIAVLERKVEADKEAPADEAPTG